MQKIIIIIILFFHSQAIGLSHGNIISKITKSINAIDRNANIGIKNLKTGKILYQQNIDRYYTFASGLKMITIFGLQEYFGKNYIFTNKLLKKAMITI